MVLWRPTRPFRTNTQKRCPFHYRGLECKSRKSRNIGLLLLLSHFSHVRLCATPEMAAHQASPSLGFSRQEHWSGCHFLLQCMKVKSESGLAQSCPTLSDPIEVSPPGCKYKGWVLLLMSAALMLSIPADGGPELFFKGMQECDLTLLVSSKCIVDWDFSPS